MNISNRIIKTISLLLLTATVGFAQAPPQDWFHLDNKADNYYGVSDAKAYKEFLKGKKSTKVIVAVIDSGIDTEHEDLKNVMWVNTKEANGVAGKDDDGNGYIDDVHGWNFIGGKNGEVGPDNLEVTRIYRKLKPKYEKADVTKLSKKEKIEYALFEKTRDEVKEKYDEANANVAQMAQTKEMLMGAINAMEKALEGKKPTQANIDAVDAGDDKDLGIAKRIFGNIFAQGETVESIDNVKKEITEQIQGGLDYYEGQAKYYYNLDFDPRNIVGDNYDNINERIYGNNEYEGPDALHGTHVGGIIGAERNNNIGMDGVANNVQIMTVRAVPDGDERDKDVANAIRYAVDNGAKVINMSFGKAYSPGKQAVDDAVRYAVKHDVLLIHAAGNSNQDNDVAENYPNDKYKKRGWFWKPKMAKTWIEVGALNYEKGENMVAPFSNYGTNNVDLFAPGMKIYSTLPDNEYRNLQGTSMAAPVVAGVAALVRSYYPNLSAKQVKKILMASSTKVNQQVIKPGTEDKVPFSSLSVSGGIVNAYAALKMAARMSK